MKSLFEITDDMPIESIIDLLQESLCGSNFTDWKQATAHPESFEAKAWGSGSIIAREIECDKYTKVGEFYDSCNLFLVVNAVRALPILLQYISTLQIKLIEAEKDSIQ